MLIKGFLHQAFSIAVHKTGRFKPMSIAMDGALGMRVVFVTGQSHLYHCGLSEIEIAIEIEKACDLDSGPDFDGDLDFDFDEIIYMRLPWGG